MAFPPQFSSTATYENRYDLNEIDVFLEGNFSNPMFFNISGIPQNLSFGKHYFNLSILDSSNQEYELRPDSKILFELPSIKTFSSSKSYLFSYISVLLNSGGKAINFSI